MTDNIDHIASNLANQFIYREQELQKSSQKFRLDEAIQNDEIKRNHLYLNENGRPEFVKLGQILQSTIEHINTNVKEKIRFTGGGDSPHITVQHNGRVVFLYFKYLAINGDGTGPCIDCYFGNDGAGIGNGSRGRVGTLIPFLAAQGNILWGEAPSSARYPIGSVKDVAAMLLKWFQAYEAKMFPGSQPTCKLSHVNKLTRSDFPDGRHQ